MLPFKVTWRLRNVNIGSSFSLTDKSNFIMALCKIRGKTLRWNKLINGNDFLLRVMWFVKFWSHVINHYYPVKFAFHRTFGIKDITSFIYHKTIYNHVIKESCYFVHGNPIPWAINLPSLIVMSPVKIEMKLCYLSRDNCVIWLLWVMILSHKPLPFHV